MNNGHRAAFLSRWWSAIKGIMVRRMIAAGSGCDCSLEIEQATGNQVAPDIENPTHPSGSSGV